MRGISFGDMACSVARTLDVVGERWTLLILRDAFNGVRRFEDFQSSLGIGRNVLTQRLKRLVDEGIFDKRLYSERPARSEYVLTAKGRALRDVVDALQRWADDWVGEERPAARTTPDGPPGAVR